MTKCPIFVLSAICAALCLGCASAPSKQVSAPPRAAQFDLALDWYYELAPGFGKYLGATPLELGSVNDIGQITLATTSFGKVIAIDNATAREVWHKDFDMPVTAGPVVYGSGVFVALGTAGAAALALKLGAQIEGNGIVADELGATSIPNLYACGDCTGGLLQIAKAVHEGAITGLAIVKAHNAKRS